MADKKKSAPKTVLGKKMKLTTKDRISVLNLFPESSDKMGIRIMSDIRGKVDLDQSEWKFLSTAPVLGPGRVAWDEVDKELGKRTITFTDIEFSWLKDQIEAKNNAKPPQLTESMKSLIDKIENMKVGDGNGDSK